MQLFILAISSVLFLSYAGLLLYYRAAWNAIPAFQPPPINQEPSTFISVIVPARNEAGNLPALLQSLSEQTYPANLFEVLIIDDHSTDDTASVVQSFPANNVSLISLKDHIDGTTLNSYKKKAIETGINQSQGTLIVTTDADCTMPAGWLLTIASFYEKKQPAFIAAPVRIDCGPRFIELFQSLDFMTLQGITGASVYKKFHSMCNGANMAYEKKAFEEVNGFAGIDNIASGDDMLLMHKIWKLYPARVLFLKSKDVIVQTSAVKTIAEFFNQRIRWASKADKYDDKRIFWVLLLVYLFNCLLLILPIVALIKNVHYSILNIQYSIFTVWLKLLVLKTITELIFLYPVAGFFGNQKLLWYFPFMQPFHIIYTVIAGWLGKFGSYQWKDRKVK